MSGRYRVDKSSTMGAPGAVAKKTVCDRCDQQEESQLRQTLCMHYTLCMVCMGGSYSPQGFYNPRFKCDICMQQKKERKAARKEASGSGEAAAAE